MNLDVFNKILRNGAITREKTVSKMIKILKVTKNQGNPGFLDESINNIIEMLRIMIIFNKYWIIMVNIVSVTEFLTVQKEPN